MMRKPLVVMLYGVLLWLSAAAQADWYRDEQGIMGTRVAVELSHEDPLLARQAMAAVMTEMRRIDTGMSPYKPDSELSRLNQQASVAPMPVSGELFELLERSVGFSLLTRGAFDITFASAGFLYDYRHAVRPSAAQLAQAVDAIDYRRLVLNPIDHSVYFTRDGVKIDLGGIGKGHAVDRCIALLQGMGIHDALVTAGGDTRVIGQRWGRPWHIGVRDPRHADKVVAMIPLQDVAVSTSGDYERFFEADGVRYHHIIDPKTGDSARELQSVTVIGRDSTTTDALSTSVFVLGLKAGLALIESLPDIDAVLVDGSGQLHYSSGLLNPVSSL